MTRFANKIREARTAAGLTQSELARALETSESQISKWENGENEPRAHTLERMAVALHRPVGFFFDPAPALVDGGMPTDA